jgi:hypothetical protein
VGVEEERVRRMLPLALRNLSRIAGVRAGPRPGNRPVSTLAILMFQRIDVYPSTSVGGAPDGRMLDRHERTERDPRFWEIQSSIRIPEL